MTLVTPVLGVEARRHSIDTFDDSYVMSMNATSAGAWPAANLAVYVPIRVAVRVVVRQLWLASEATGTGNVDVGLYNQAGTRLVSAGSTAKIAATNEQIFNVTDTTTGPGLYFWALSCSNSTDTFNRAAPVAPIPAALGVLTESLGSVTLPATATWVVNQTLAYVPMGGVLLETVAA